MCMINVVNTLYRRGQVTPSGAVGSFQPMKSDDIKRVALLWNAFLAAL